MSPNVPPEILFGINEQVSTIPELLSLSSGCSAFRDQAQSTLFDTPIIRDDYHQPRFVDAIIMSPDRLSPIFDTYTRDPPAICELSAALKNMTDLRKLAIVSPNKIIPRALEEIAKLVSLSWGRSFKATSKCRPSSSSQNFQKRMKHSGRLVNRHSSAARRSSTWTAPMDAGMPSVDSTVQIKMGISKLSSLMWRRC